MKAGEIWANPEEFNPVKVWCIDKEEILNTDARTLEVMDEIDTITQYIVDRAINSPRLPLQNRGLLVKDKLYQKIFVSLLEVFGIVKKTKTFYALSNGESEDE
jgi:hypothetical protein